MNFLTNALKFKKNDIPPRIVITAEERDDYCIFSIQDNGVGFDSTLTSRMFGLFQRFHSPEKYEGTGIGLATVKKIVEQRGGKVWAQGTPGEGATFYFSLPHTVKQYENITG
jgi:light-regulated signal transduction histidine kinase (bacteriophytochrome)